MKKLLLVAMMLISSLFLAFAESVDVKYGGQVIGQLDYSYDIQTFETRSGCFITVTITNNSDEYVGGTISPIGIEGCTNSFTVGPHKTTKVTYGCNEVPRGIKLVYVHIQ